jgi:uncharacterized protein YndB with AHSA1/START domain
MGTTTSITARVDAEPDAVFETVTDPSRLPEWNEAIRRVVVAPAALTAGAEWVVEMHALGRSWHSRSRVEEIDRAGRVFRYRSCTDDGNPSFVDWRWSVTAEDGGRAWVTVTGDLNPKTFWRKALFVHIRRRQLVGHELARSLESLAAAARATAASG